MDGGPHLSGGRQVDSGGPSVNPVTRVVPTQMIRTQVPMIDVFNCLVESQKIPIFSVAGEPYNQLLARIAIQADAEIIVFGGLGLIFDDYYLFCSRFEDEGTFGRTVMFVNLASDPIVERVLTPDLVLKVAERFAEEERKRVLVLMTDMTAYADALKEIGISMERVPSNRGYIGDLYSQLAVRYERACSYKKAGSVTILTVTTMPGNDVTHPVPDNTGYITEGQFYLHDGMIDPWFGHIRRHFNQPDFGLNYVFPWLLPFDQLLEHQDVLTLYRRMLGETWAYVRKRMQDYDSFSFEAVVLYIARWDIVRHWQQLQVERGRAVFEALVTEAMGEYAKLYS
jgi:V/A-type H+/Na+-transporting ATPase subunit B